MKTRGCAFFLRPARPSPSCVLAEDLQARAFTHPGILNFRKQVPACAPGTRELVAHPNYLVVYQVGADAIEVVAVVHARQQYPH